MPREHRREDARGFLRRQIYLSPDQSGDYFMSARLPLALVAAAFVGFAATPASAQVYTLTATLTGEGEATQIANGINTGAFGDATIVIDLGARTVNYTVRVFN